MAKPGEYDFEPLGDGGGFFRSEATTRSVSIFQWIYRTDGHGLKKSKSVYRVKGPADRWREINERAIHLCALWNKTYFDAILWKKSETI